MNTTFFNIYGKLVMAVVASLLLISYSVPAMARYGKLRYQSGYGEEVTIKDLIENSDDYNIFYSGYAVDNPSGIMFDPKKDDKTLVPTDRWKEIENKETVSEVVSWIQIHDFPSYYPGLYRVLGPDDQFYGYLFTGWHHVFAKEVDKRALRVYNLPEPPHYYGR